MSDYQIGKDFQELQARLEKLENAIQTTHLSGNVNEKTELSTNLETLFRGPADRRLNPPDDEGWWTVECIPNDWTGFTIPQGWDVIEVIVKEIDLQYYITWRWSR